MLTSFTPLLSFSGGCLIGLAAVLMMGLFGRISGISGISASLLSGTSQSEGGWRLGFLTGLVLSGLFAIFIGRAPDLIVPSTMPLLGLGGLMVGLGTYFGAGCTSGHGVCGLARLSNRSMVATLTFMATAAITVFILRHLVGA